MSVRVGLPDCKNAACSSSVDNDVVVLAHGAVGKCGELTRRPVDRLWSGYSLIWTFPSCKSLGQRSRSISISLPRVRPLLS